MIDDPYLINGPAVISFSGGRTSGYLLKHIIDAHGGRLPNDVAVCFANTGKEMPETLDFVQECSDQWGVHITWLEYDPDAPHRTKIVDYKTASRDGAPFEAVIKNRKMLPNPVTRFCTIEMKIRRFSMYAQHWLEFDRWTSVVGLRADEPRRLAKLGPRNEARKDRWFTVAPLGPAGVGKPDVLAWWKKQPFDLQLEVDDKGDTLMGNCDLCFLKGAQEDRTHHYGPPGERRLVDQPGNERTMFGHHAIPGGRALPRRSALLPGARQPRPICPGDPR